MADVTDRARTAGLILYPGFPEGATLARWPDDDVGAFLQTAVDANVSLLYVIGVAAAEAAAADQLDAADAGFAGDSLVAVLAGWTCGPIVHVLTLTDPAWEQARNDAIAEADVADFRNQIDRRERDHQVETLARQVVDDPAFHDHGSQGRDDRKFAAVCRRLPDLDDHLTWAVVRRADRIDRAEKQADREADLARTARRQMADGSSKRGAAEQLGISVNVLDRILQTNPPDGP